MPRPARCRTCRTPLTSANASPFPKVCNDCQEKQEKRVVERHASNPLFLVGTDALARMLGGGR